MVQIKKSKIKAMIITIIVLILASLGGLAINYNIQNTEDGFKAEIEYSEEQKPATIEGDRGELVELEEINGEEIKTVEEVDGGKFEDENTGTSVTEGEYEDLGWAETYNVSSPEAFKNATLGKCIRANNKYGAQCVSLARVFWWSYANRDVSTCGTGMAKGMMQCAKQNAGKDFQIYYGKFNIQAGDWLVFTGGQYGHVGMALGPAKNGYVTLLGENQGGAYCQGGGAATNIINISTKNLIGGYRPKKYIKPTPKPTPKPAPKPTPAKKETDQCKVWNVKSGDTLGKIMKTCKGKITWGEAMNNYAKQWRSIKFKKSPTVYDGWNSKNGVGLFAGDTIEFKK